MTAAMRVHDMSATTFPPWVASLRNALAILSQQHFFYVASISDMIALLTVSCAAFFLFVVFSRVLQTLFRRVDSCARALHSSG